MIFVILEKKSEFKEKTSWKNWELVRIQIVGTYWIVGTLEIIGRWKYQITPLELSDVTSRRKVIIMYINLNSTNEQQNQEINKEKE